MPPVRFSAAEVLYSFRTRSKSSSSRLARVLLVALALLQAVAIFGYGFFVRNPQNLASRPWAIEMFPGSYEVFARAQILLAFATLALFLWSEVRGRWLLAFLAAVGTGLAAELAGTTYGIPFGAYSYTALLGAKIADRVPYLVPLSWFFMALTSYAIVGRRFPGVRGFLFRVVFGSLLLTLWDLTLDPAMSNLTPFWLWEQPGGFFGTPLVNVLGWFVTGCAILLFFEAFRVGSWAFSLPGSFLVAFYLVNLALPVGIVLLAGLWQPALLTAAGLLSLGIGMLLFGARPNRWLTAEAR